jgi:hypothetical protein
VSRAASDKCQKDIDWCGITARAGGVDALARAATERTLGSVGAPAKLTSPRTRYRQRAKVTEAGGDPASSRDREADRRRDRRAASRRSFTKSAGPAQQADEVSARGEHAVRAQVRAGPRRVGGGTDQ